MRMLVGIRRFHVLLAFTFAAHAAQDPGEEGWRSLFNGEDLSGWIVKCKPDDGARTWWKVEDGAIVVDCLDAGQHDYVWLLSEREYADFALRFRFQAFRDSPGNSGIQVRSRYDDEAGWLDGPQIDIHPPGPWRTGMVWDETRGNRRWLWPVIPEGTWVDASMAKPDSTFHFASDEPSWNEFEIVARGARLKAVLNGVTVMDYDGEGVLNDATHRERRVGMRGHIALQIHSNDKLRIRFKDIRIREF